MLHRTPDLVAMNLGFNKRRQTSLPTGRFLDSKDSAPWIWLCIKSAVENQVPFSPESFSLLTYENIKVIGNRTIILPVVFKRVQSFVLQIKVRT
jgi:hypothetical protein